MSEPKPRILIAEDDADARTILTDAFVYWGYPLLAAVDGEEALRLAQEHPIDVALLDVVLRLDGLSGLELAQRLREINSHILIIMMTAYVSAQDSAKATKQGALYYLPKPFTPGFVRGLVDDKWAAYLRGCREQIGEICVDWRREAASVNGTAVPLTVLTDRECDMLAELSTGKSDQKIADALGLGVTSVRTHVRGIMRRLGFKNQTQAALFWQAYLRRRGNQ